MIEDTDSPTFAFFDFDFSELTDNNFDMPNGITPNITTDSSASVTSTSSTSSSSTVNHQQIVSSDSNAINIRKLEASRSSIGDTLLWSNIEELAKKMVYNNRNTLSCLDKFIREPNSDLVELVQCSDDDYFFFKNLVADSSNTPQTSTTAHYRDSNLASSKLIHKEKPPYAAYKYTDTALQQRKTNDSDRLNCFKKKLNTDSSCLYSQSGDSNTRQLTNALMRQTQRSTKKNDTVPQQNTLSSHQLSEANYLTSVAPYTYAATLTTLTKKQIAQCYQNQKASITMSSLRKGTAYHHPYYQRYGYSPGLGHSPNRAIQQKPTMYSSDLTKAQILEIQAISKAQQDFIRARERQEAEKSMMFKHHIKK
ncbi:hypothetical protein A0J61_08817 [Choanephora cucurbitarum]|uniref:Uncharacterized protein n=1 Tax=Choanephora cucurbitarum TaxID=101091 RepID=A0A1C7N737_9FUNG|nr:hypothetical protein A0J61_08817 [Choanephora cucurbitarum]